MLAMFFLWTCKDEGKEEAEVEALIEEVEAVESEIDEITKSLEEDTEALEAALKELDSIDVQN